MSIKENGSSWCGKWEKIVAGLLAVSISLTVFSCVAVANTLSSTTTTETTPTPSAVEELQPSNKWFILNTNKISVRVSKTKTIKINYVVFGNSFNYSQKDISSLIKKGYFKFKSNKPKIAKVTKKGSLKESKKERPESR